MAYYYTASNFQDEFDEYNQFYDNDFSTAQPFNAYSPYDLPDPSRYIQFDNSYYEHALSRSSVAYSAYSFTQPADFSTQFVVSHYCNINESKAPETEEKYALEHYVSGYDIDQTYGKPLPPSDQICYPRSTGSVPNITSSIDDSPHGKETVSVEAEEEIHESETSDSEGGEEGIQESQTSQVFDGGVGNGYDDDHGRQVRQIPPGYGMESLDLCEGLFGYWPCLDRMNRRNYSGDGYGNDNGRAEDNYCWQRTADYLFGNPDPYGGTMPQRGSYGDPVYNYERRHYQQQPLFEQLELDDGDEYSILHHSAHNYEI